MLITLRSITKNGELCLLPLSNWCSDLQNLLGHLEREFYLLLLVLFHRNIPSSSLYFCPIVFQVACHRYSHKIVWVLHKCRVLSFWFEPHRVVSCFWNINLSWCIFYICFTKLELISNLIELSINFNMVYLFYFCKVPIKTILKKITNVWNTTKSFC